MGKKVFMFPPEHPYPESLENAPFADFAIFLCFENGNKYELNWIVEYIVG